MRVRFRVPGSQALLTTCMELRPPPQCCVLCGREPQGLRLGDEPGPLLGWRL